MQGPARIISTMPSGRRFDVEVARRPSLTGILLLSAAVAATLLAEDWIAGIAVILLWAVWRCLPDDEGAPALALPLTAQWAEVTSGIFYFALSGRRLEAMVFSDYRPMVLIGLGCVAALACGLALGTRFVLPPRPTGRPAFAFGLHALILVYVMSVGLTGFAEEIAWRIPQLTQGILVLTYCRFAFLFLIMRRLSRPRFRWAWIGTLAGVEVLLGFTGYFAGFREPIMMTALAVLQGFDRRRVQHWLMLGGLGVMTVGSGLLWISIRGDYRGSFGSPTFADSRLARLELVGSLASRKLEELDLDRLLADADSFLNRLWTVYYPALALKRVPSVIPHEHGVLLWGAVRHVLTPRLLFPEKAELPSDSEMVRRYSGVRVAGTEEGTSIAFGYAAESYVDFGLPWMFVPVFAYGVLMGVAYRGLLRGIRNRELAVGLVTVTYWLCLSQFARSWIKILGLSGTMLIYLGGGAVLLDRYLLGARTGRDESRRDPGSPAAAAVELPRTLTGNGD